MALSVLLAAPFPLSPEPPEIEHKEPLDRNESAQASPFSLAIESQECLRPIYVVQVAPRGCMIIRQPLQCKTFPSTDFSCQYSSSTTIRQRSR
jgi:hypothetical protein